MNKFIEVASATGVTIYVNVAAIICFREHYFPKGGKYITEITTIGNESIMADMRAFEIKEQIDEIDREDD
ncbi:MAG: hypothetical protein J6Y20_05645 [Lachnospiraceae bacterium]|nr:hypothetical protein [Lachnospiraceae bacterium]